MPFSDESCTYRLNRYREDVRGVAGVWASICLQLVTFSKKMLPVVGKCSKNVSSLRQMLNFQYILSICLKLLTFSELSVD